MNTEQLQKKIRERWQLQGERNDMLSGFSGMDPQKMGDMSSMMGMMQKLPEIKKAYELTQKIEETRAELKQDGHIELAPAMITLPEFEEERMALMAEEHDILVDLVDHMHALSERVDQLEQTYRALAIEEKTKLSLSKDKQKIQSMISNNYRTLGGPITDKTISYCS